MKNTIRWILMGMLLVIGNIEYLSAQTPMALQRDTGIVRQVDVQPLFPGGMQGWQRFLQNNMDISGVVEAMDSTAYVEYGMRQTAYLEFTVCEDGQVCDVEVVNAPKISPEFAKEALRVMRRSPRWMPGKVKDKAVRTRFRQSIVAVLE